MMPPPTAEPAPAATRPPAAGSARTGVRDRTIGVASVTAVVIVWWAVARLGLVNPLLLAGPDAVASSAISLTLSGLLPTHIAVSMGRVLVGFFAAFVVALPLGTLIGMSRTVRAAVNPLIELVRPIPPIAMIPLAILWLGIGETSKYSIIGYGAFFPILLSTVAGFAAIDPVHVRAALTQTQVSRSRSGIPILSQLPLIGRLFSQTDTIERKQDLLILITPHIVDEGEVVRPSKP